MTINLENLTKQDLQEIKNLLLFKEKYKNYLKKEVDKPKSK